MAMLERAVAVVRAERAERAKGLEVVAVVVVMERSLVMTPLVGMVAQAVLEERVKRGEERVVVVVMV